MKERKKPTDRQTNRCRFTIGQKARRQCLAENEELIFLRKKASDDDDDDDVCVGGMTDKQTLTVLIRNLFADNEESFLLLKMNEIFLWPSKT